MKRKGIIVADDGETRIVVTAVITHKGALCREEQLRMRKRLLRGISDVFPEVPYSDFGIENTRVK